MATSKYGLKIRKHSSVVTFDVKRSHLFVQHGMLVVAETNRGEEAAQVVKLPVPCEKHGLHEEIKVNEIIRQANEDDLNNLKNLNGLEADYLKKANEVFEQKAPGAKLISCELLFSKKKLILYYRMLEDGSNQDSKKKQKSQAPQIHFNSREMNKELFHQLNIPIELKEMGNRASAYVIGGVGHCGCGLCCTTFLHKPMQVAVKMAKEQSLAINIPKLSGVCGKLLCCLAYECGQYEGGALRDVQPVKHDELNDIFSKS